MSQPSLEEVLGYRFRHKELVQEALTHKSYAAEKKSGRHNERLEFLGDSVLAIVVAHYLFELYPNENEGRLSKVKALLVSKPALAAWAREIGLGRHLHLGAGEDSTGGRARASLLANAMEGVIGAIFLDGGYDAASKFIITWLYSQPAVLAETDYKSRLQEIVQKRFKFPPAYDLTQAVGPDHDKTFRITVKLDRWTIGFGAGKSKKEAEQDAAKDALKKILSDIL